MKELVDPVPLGRVFLHKDGPAPDERAAVAANVEKIDREFDAGTTAVWGRRRSKRDRERIWPADYEIDWVEQSTDTDEYCSVCARRRGLANWTRSYTRAELNDEYVDLAISRADWDRIIGVQTGGGGGKKRRGPQPGTIDRFGQADRALFPEIERMTKNSKMSVTAAAQRLANDGMIEGPASPQSKADRLARRYRARERE